jgi:replicative DNA helicase
MALDQNKPLTQKNKSQPLDLSKAGNELAMGRKPPQSIQLEEAVLGAIMLDKDAFPAVMDVLRPESFYTEAHQIIFRVMVDLFNKSKPIDLLTVVEDLKKVGSLQKIGGAHYVVDLTNKVASAANIEYHARMINEKHMLREMIGMSGRVIRDAFDDTTDVFNLMDEAEQSLYNITQNNLSRNTENISTVARLVLNQIELVSKKEEGLTGVPTGFNELDRITSGWQVSDLIIIAARPAMGKTAFVLSMARNAAIDKNKPVAFFSLEMTKAQLVTRILSAESGLGSEKLRNGKLADHEWGILHQAVEKLQNAPIHIDDSPGINIFELRAKCRRLKKQYNIELVIIDYLQLMTSGPEHKGNREQEISSISRALKSLAKELNVAVIALSQLNRSVETRSGTAKRPQLSDLRESGAIEQDADLVSFIYRPEYYGLDVDDQNRPTKNVAEIIIAKHRNGALGTARLKFIGEITKFENLEDETDFDFSYSPTTSTSSAPASVTVRPSKMNNNTNDVPF